jgi:hypothetical protein
MLDHPADTLAMHQLPVGPAQVLPPFPAHGQAA